MINTVRLGMLRISESNVRKTDRAAEIPELAADILERGLLQNLVVTPAPDGGGYFEVDAGGRRYLALMHLVELGEMTLDHPVSVLVELPENALETSLAENIQRLPMNAADELEAFATIIQRYEDAGVGDRATCIARTARRQGVSVRHVEQRLRLANLAPDILEALRDGRITLDAAKAYAAYPDHGLQMKVFRGEELRKYGDSHGARYIRDAMKGKVYRQTDRQVLYIGVDAYLAAGGRMERELFMGAEDDDVLLDMKLVDRLCEEKARDDADRLAKAEGFAAGAVRIWNGSYEVPPKQPEGFRTCYTSSTLAPKERKAAIAHFTLPTDGGDLVLHPQHCFVPVAKSTQAGSSAGPSHLESAEQRAARIRKDAIFYRAARLAAPPIEGTPLEGVAFWPEPHRYVEAIDVEGEEVILALLIRVPAADIDAALAEAEQLLDAEESDATAALAAEAEADLQAEGAGK